MKRTLLTILSLVFALGSVFAGERIPGLIASEKVIARSPDSAGIYLYTPAIAAGFDGRIVAAIDYGGPGTSALDGPKSDIGDYASGNQVRVLLSDDKGRTWRDSGARLPMMHEILFKAGGRLYMIGHSGRLLISCSEDNGVSWSEPSVLREDGRWHQSCGAVDIHKGTVSLVYEKWISKGHAWPGVGPVLMQADENSDLCNPDNWQFSGMYNPDPDMAACAPMGIPAVPGGTTEGAGILETSVVRVYEPGNPFYDPEDRSVVLLMRSAAGYRDLGVMLKGVRKEDGSLSIEKLRLNGREIFFMPIPGGRLKFHICHDPVTGLYWMVHSQITGNMSERRRLALSWSADLLNWTPAGLIAVGPADNASRHYATCMIDGDNLYVVSRSGDLEAKNAHDNNLTTFHVVKNFRRFAK